MAQFQKVSTEVYGNTPNNVYQRPYNPVAHESSVQVSPTNIWGAPSTSPVYNSTLLLFSPEDFKPLRSFFLSLLFFPFLRGCAHPVVCHKPPRTSVELSQQIAPRACSSERAAGGWGLCSTAARAPRGQLTTAPRAGGSADGEVRRGRVRTRAGAARRGSAEAAAGSRGCSGGRGG